MKNIPQQLKDLGASKGLCQEWQDKLQGEVTVEFLAVLFKYGIQFCVNNDYPTLDYLRENFKGDTSQYNIYIDEIADCENIKKIADIDNALFILEQTHEKECLALKLRYIENKSIEGPYYLQP